MIRFGIVILATLLATPARPDALADLAAACTAALQAGDGTGFEAAAEAIKLRRDIFDTATRRAAEACLSRGYGEPWKYDFVSGRWLPSKVAEDRVAAAEAARVARQRAAAHSAAEAAAAEAARAQNARQVAALVYLSCSTLLSRDQLAAMTSAVCVDSFLANGLPPLPRP